jgi:anti-sigma factor RsiW
MSENQNDDSARDELAELLTEYADGSIGAADRARVDEACARDPAYAAALSAHTAARALLRRAPRAEAPTDMVPRVRGKLAAERRSVLARARMVAAPLLAATFAAVTLVIGVQAVGPAAESGLFAAGVGHRDAVRASVHTTGLSVDEIAVAAAKSDVAVVAREPDRVVLSGDRRAVQRLMLALRVQADEKGGRVTGAIPPAGDEFLITVVATPAR